MSTPESDGSKLERDFVAPTNETPKPLKGEALEETPFQREQRLKREANEQEADKVAIRNVTRDIDSMMERAQDHIATGERRRAMQVYRKKEHPFSAFASDLKLLKFLWKKTPNDARFSLITEMLFRPYDFRRRAEREKEFQRDLGNRWEE